MTFLPLRQPAPASHTYLYRSPLPGYCQAFPAVRVLAVMLFIIPAVLFGCALRDPEPRPPNIVIIFTDDQGYADLGSYGHPTIRTPHIDRMAAEGARFTQFYVAASVCTPSRAGLLTGRLPIRSGMKSDRYRVLFPNSLGGLPADEITIASALRQQGYATAAIGKWHLGHQPEFLPSSHGFDYFFGIPYSNDMSPATNPGWEVAESFPPLPLMRNGETIEEEPDQRLFTREFTEEAVRFIQDNRNQPFFLYVPHVFPHTPLFAGPDFEGTSRRGLYGDVIEEVDWSTGTILQTIRDLGLAENTFVFFTSDNGPWLREGVDGGSAGLLRDGKGTTWEGGFRVPAIAWWPGTIDPGRVSLAVATTMDLFTTSLNLAGADLPDDRVIDGADLMPVLLGETDELHDEFPYYRGTSLFAFRKGSWKLHFITQSAYVGDSPVEHDPPQLYHLERDPGENYNVAEEYPEIVDSILQAVARHTATLVEVESELDNMEWHW